MKIKRYFAPDIRRAMRMVRQEQGPDAVILSNRQVKNGVEVVAAVDYDANLFQREHAPEHAADAAPVRATADALPETTALDDVGTRPYPDARPARRPAPQISENWVQDPALVEMRQELKDLRDLMESQLCGLAWGDLARRHPLHARLVRRLMELGLTAELCRQIVQDVPADESFDTAWRRTLGILSHRITVTDDDILARGGVVALLGPTGVGKTTTIAKLAARYALRHGKNRVALVTMDNFRIGAHEQISTYGRILGAPVRVVADQHGLGEAVESLSDKDLILIDTAGMSQRDVRLSEHFAALRGGAAALRSYLVLSATTQSTAMDEALRAFSGANLQGCIITKLDETSSLGGALAAAIRHGLPLAYISDGQRVPEDLHPARVANLITRCVSTWQRTGQTLAEESLELAYGRVAANAHV